MNSEELFDRAVIQCKKLGLPYRIVDDRFHVKTIGGYWFFTQWGKGIRLYHESRACCYDKRPYHVQFTQIIEPEEVVSYVYQHDAILYGTGKVA